MTVASGARFGLTLSNRGIIIGATRLDEMLQLAEQADRDRQWHSVWVGDSILAKPRLDAICMLSALAVRTERLKMGAACMASTPLRQPLVLAYQWASLDFLSGGRTIFVACQGSQAPAAAIFEAEFAALGVEPGSRMERMEEAVEILRLLSTRDGVSYRGHHGWGIGSARVTGGPDLRTCLEEADQGTRESCPASHLRPVCPHAVLH